MPSKARPNIAAAAKGDAGRESFRIRSIAVKTGRIACEVEVPDARARYVTPRLAAQVRRRYPSLQQHACVNARGRTFADALEGTSLPHLFEHLAIDFQTRACDDADAAFVGTTEWTDEPAGRALVQLSYRDDLQALAAIASAERALAELLDA